jgi:hypothetical protein
MTGLHIERIEPNADVFAEIIAKSKEFFQIGVLPELVGKFYTRSRVPLQSSTATNDLPNEQVNYQTTRLTWFLVRKCVWGTCPLEKFRNVII